MKIKRSLTFFFLMLSPVLIKAQNSEPILFFDGFEEVISNDASFENWSQENLAGWHYWHIIEWGGYDNSNCMRFENNDLYNHDWLVTNAIACENVDSLKISFEYFYTNGPRKPKFLYTYAFDGLSANSTWTEIDFELSGITGEWQHAEMLMDNSGEEIYFAFEYEAEHAEAMFILLDNFQVRIHESVSYKMVGESKHFEFYTSWPDSGLYWNQLEPFLETQYLKLSGLWNRPGIENVFREEEPIRVFYTESKFIEQARPESPAWKCGFHDAKASTIYFSPLLSPEQYDYYKSLEGLVINAFSQMAIERKTLREEGSDYSPPFFTEGFGLYESGFRPRRDSILRYMELFPKLDYDMIRDTTGIRSTFKKDLIVCNIEGQILSGWSYLGVNPGAYTYEIFQWPAHLEYFYGLDEDSRIKLQQITPWFDCYAASTDTAHLGEVIGWFQDARDFYIENYNFDPQHRFNVVLYSNPEMGARHMVYDDYNGGSGCGGDKVDEISPSYNFDSQAFYSKYFGYAGLTSHEFFHVFQNHFMWGFPGGFWAEGSADFSQRHALGWEMPEHSFWKIKEMFEDYASKHPAVEINLKHISTNPYLELDIYFLGDAFFEYLWLYHGGFEKIREFFNQQMDYSVFETSYEEIDKGYIAYLKSLVYGPTHVDSKSGKDLVRLYPNPVGSVLYFEFSESLPKGTTLEIFSTDGRQQMQSPVIGGQFSIDLGIYKPGIYFYNLQYSPYKNEVGRFVVE